MLIVGKIIMGKRCRHKARMKPKLMDLHILVMLMEISFKRQFKIATYPILSIWLNH